MRGSIRVFSALLFCCTIALGDTAAAAQFPNRPVRLIVPFPPGGGTDIIARVLARGLASKWGQPVVVENRPGASGTIGFTLGASAAADGHTLLFATHHLAVPPQEGYKLGYDPIKSFIPISLVADSPSYLLVNPSLPAKTVKEFIALAQAKPGQLNVATNGDASLKLKSFTDKTRINVVDVPFSGGAAAIASVMSGETQATFASQGVPLAQAGKLRALAIFSLARSSLLPDVPTIAEAANLPVDRVTWYGVLAPAGTPKEIITQIYRDLAEVIKSSDSQSVMSKAGLNPVANTPAEFAKIINGAVHEYWGARYVK